MVRHGRCWTTSDRHTTVSDAVHFARRSTASAREPRPHLEPGSGTVPQRPGHGGATLKPVFLADSRSPPQGWPLWLSADHFRSFTELEKIEELEPWRTIRALTSFKRIGWITW